MPTRKPHRKSRKGCVPCKKRHIKCGEERPNCLNCLEYDLDCHFLPIVGVSLRDPLRASSSPDSGSAAHDASKAHIPAGIGFSTTAVSDDLDTSDLELLHHFLTVTYSTMSNVPEEQKLWQTIIISIGFQHKFLLRGILAQAALHLSSMKTGSESINYLIKASTHQDIALSQFRKALDNVSTSTFDAVLAFSCLLPLHSIALAACSTTRSQIHDHEHDNLTEFLKAIRLFRSVNKLLLPSLSIFTTSTITPLLQITTQHLPEADTYSGQHSIAVLESICCLDLSSRFPATTTDSHQTSVPEHRQILSQAIHELRLVFSRIAHPSSSTRFTLGIALLWTIVVPDEFMMLIDSRNPAAMVILAHFAAQLCGYDETVWWLTGLGASMVGIIDDDLGKMPDKDNWMETMKWPKDVAARARRESAE